MMTRESSLHAAKAIAQYRGDFLPGAYDDWLLEIRSALERQCVDLCDLVCAARARTGDLAGAVDAARRRVQLQPLEEVGYRTLMELQADLGDRAGALSTYHHCASVLERELGVVPDASTRKTFQRLMAHARPAEKSPPVTEPAVGRPGLAAAQLVGRSAELHVLQDVWRTAVAGRRGFVLVRGGAGVGKTRLVAELAEMARLQGAVVASAQCFGTSGRLALAPVADWLRNDAVQSAAATLDPAWRAEVGRLATGRGSRRTRDRSEGNGGRLAAPPLLRGPGAGAAGCRPPAAAGAGQPAMVRPGDAGLHHVLPGAGRATPSSWWLRRCARTTSTKTLNS